MFAYVGGLSISQSFLITPIVTKSCARWGVRQVMPAGVLLLSISFVGASFATEMWQLMLAQGVCFGWGMGILFVGTIGLLPQWFQKRSGLANALAASGSGFGGLGYSFITEALISGLGHPNALRILGRVTLAVNFIAVLLLRQRSTQQQSSKVLSWRLLRTPDFVFVMLFGVFSILGYVVCLFTLPSYARSIGLSSSQGSVAGALLNLGQIVGRPTLGLLGDMFDRFLVTTAASVLGGLLTLLLWTFAKSYALLLLYSVLHGLVAGAFWAVIAPILTDIVGLQVLPTALSMVWLVLVIPSTCPEAIALELVDSRGGSYLGVTMCTGAMYLGAAMCSLAVYLIRKRRVIDCVLMT
ncbi:hypothetical protein CEP51_005257 [Fusarium floridanum]|uniref:Major facilitator superfamily (MFS) profile domain-containing protein n=1 Tax=Fusarium floridanum TaxID=1325733 RepID=A0A428RXQ3_9HYPO|nr:hypothetical protein CEP51_005257 [Fusarium floridanum]